MAELHDRVRRQLDASAVSYRVRHHDEMPGPITSPADFAAALGYPLGRIMKTLVCRSRSTGAFAAVVCPMDTRVDFAATARQLDTGRLETANPEQLKAVVGYPRGGVSPLGLDSHILIAIARQSLDYETVLVGGGAAGVEVEIAPRELLRITGAVAVDFGPGQSREET